MKEPRYLGDAVYVRDSPLGILLYTSDGIFTQSRIYMDDAVLQAFLQWVGAELKDPQASG